MRKYLYSPVKQKVLLALLSGVALGLTRSAGKHWHLLESLPTEFKKIDRDVLRRTMREFYSERLVRLDETKDGTLVATLTQEGRRFAQRYNPKYPRPRVPGAWDSKWRFVSFDIPEKNRDARDAFRAELKILGFKELQKSLWVYPHDVFEPIHVLAELYDVRRYLRTGVIASLFPDADLRIHFDLPPA